MVPTTKINVVWVVETCSLVEIDRRFRGASASIVLMAAVRTSETSVYFKETTRRYIPESYIQTNKQTNMFRSVICIRILEHCNKVYGVKPWKQSFIL
jgi:hypothetical protein